MRKTLLLLLYLAAFWTFPTRGATDNVSTEEASGLFNEDLVWTYYVDGRFGRYPSIMKMKFEGTTQYEGKEYHNYINCYYGDYIDYIEGTGYILRETKALDPILVREEEGKVYACIPIEYLHCSDGIPYDPETHMTKEVQLYDFKCPVGESFNGVYCLGSIIPLRVIEESSIEIGGNNLRRFRVRAEKNEDYGYDSWMEWDVIENIGVIPGESFNGFFAFFNISVITGGNSEAGAGYDVSLLYLSDTAGNILYQPFDWKCPDPGPGYGLFREDREWTYHSGHFGQDLTYDMKMKFDGTTEYEGRTYHNFTNTSYICTTDGKELEPCAPMLVREENGKVFARLPKGVYVAQNNMLQYDDATGLSEEVPLYDFRCPVGETFKTINDMGEVVELKVLSEGTVDVNGEFLRKITVGHTDSNSNTPSMTYDIIENIGFVSGESYFALTKYGTTQGETLYKPSICRLASSDKVWEYFGYSIDEESSQKYPMGKTDCRLSRYMTGKDLKIGDRTYTELLLDEVTTWVIDHPTYTFTEPGTDVKTEKAGNCVALLREENGKVWMRLPGETVQYTAVPYKEVWSRPVTENEETLLYDFTAEPGTLIDGWFNNVLAPAQVRSTCYLSTPDGTDLRKINFVNDRPWIIGWRALAVYIDVNYVEGVGNIGEGNLTELWSTNPYIPVPTCFCGSGEFFNNLYDRQENILFTGRGIKAPESEGVEAITDESPDGHGILYNLFGQRISEPSRGQVYILNGRKYVKK